MYSCHFILKCYNSFSGGQVEYRIVLSYFKFGNSSVVLCHSIRIAKVALKIFSP